MNWKSHIIPQKIAEFNSPYNGKILVIESMGRLYLDVDGLMQSGPFLEQTWNKGLKKLGVFNTSIKKVLILGLGGGSFVKVIKKNFPKAYITGVDIDPVIVDIGKQYFGLAEDEGLEIVIADAQSYIKQASSLRKEYDLVFIDMYTGYEIPQFAQEESFLKKIYSLKTKSGCVIFNRLYFQKYKSEANDFLDKISKMFEDVSTVAVYANLLIKVS